MENINSVSYYLINRSIELARMSHDDSYLLDFNKLLGLLLIAQSQFISLCDDYLIEEDFYNSEYGLSLKSDRDYTPHMRNNNTTRDLMIRLYPFEGKADDETYKYVHETFIPELNNKSKIILDNVLISYGSLSTEKIQKLVDGNYFNKRSNNNSDSYLISKIDIIMNPIPGVEELERDSVSTTPKM